MIYIRKKKDAKEEELLELMRKRDMHRGEWLDSEAAIYYRERGKKIGHDLDSRSKLIDEMIDKYDVTEIEATNILEGR